MNPQNMPAVSVLVVVVCLIGATTYLADAGVVAGTAVMQVFMTVLGALGVVGGVHMASNAINKNDAVKRNAALGLKEGETKVP